jgi:hypothetical protein
VDAARESLKQQRQLIYETLREVIDDISKFKEGLQ